MPYLGCLADDFFREMEITAIECIPKHIFSIKCITNVLYKMTVLYIKDQKLPKIAHIDLPKVVDLTIQSHPLFPSHPVGL